MSKAFTRESDDEMPERPTALPPPSALPPGAKNYLTPGGAEKLRNELHQLLEVERPRLAALAETDDARRQLPAIDLRIRQLQASLQSAVITPPPATPDDRVRFGATVTVREQDGTETNYRIVGVDETDLDRDWVNWLSPIAKALLNAQLGHKVRFKFPSGEKELEIIRIDYD
ncbi:MAG TPA: GreA/GreB family elongation factor [Verrucomicrobiae bacterium]|nr:GreA/GreB family elongation factor [Verrucomicrobiae bacterium]